MEDKIAQLAGMKIVKVSFFYTRSFMNQKQHMLSAILMISFFALALSSSIFFLIGIVTLMIARASLLRQHHLVHSALLGRSLNTDEFHNALRVPGVISMFTSAVTLAVGASMAINSATFAESWLWGTLAFTGAWAIFSVLSHQAVLKAIRDVT